MKVKIKTNKVEHSTVKPNNLAIIVSKRNAKKLLKQKTDPVVMENIQRILAKTNGNPFNHKH